VFLRVASAAIEIERTSLPSQIDTQKVIAPIDPVHCKPLIAALARDR
jgi:hypothetical protein